MQELAEKIRLFQRAQAGDEAARDTLVQENMGLVHMTARRFLRRGAEYEDLLQIGAIGLLKAVLRFDTSQKYQFSTYAVPLIMGEIKQFLRDDGPVKVSRGLKETAQKVRAATEKLEGRLGREPKLSEIAQEIGAAPSDVVLALEATQPAESLQKTVGKEGKTQYLIDLVKQPESQEQQVVSRLALHEAILQFDQREQKIVALRYFQQKTQAETARQLGISQVTVSRMEKRVLQELRRRLSG